MVILAVLFPITVIEVGVAGASPRWIHPCSGSVSCIAAGDDGVLLVGGDQSIACYRVDDLRLLSRFILPGNPHRIHHIAGSTVVFIRERGLLAISATGIERTILADSRFDTAVPVIGDGSFVTCSGYHQDVLVTAVDTGATLMLPTQGVADPLCSAHYRGFQVFISSISSSYPAELFVCSWQGTPSLLAHFKDGAWLQRDAQVPEDFALNLRKEELHARPVTLSTVAPSAGWTGYHFEPFTSDWDRGPFPDAISVYGGPERVDLLFSASVSAGDILTAGGRAYAAVGLEDGKVCVQRLGDPHWVLTGAALLALVLTLILTIVVRRNWRVWLPGPWPGTATTWWVTVVFAIEVAAIILLDGLRLADRESDYAFLVHWVIAFALPLGCCYATLRIRSLAEHFLAPAFLKTLWTVFLFDVAIGVLL